VTRMVISDPLAAFSGASMAIEALSASAGGDTRKTSPATIPNKKPKVLNFNYPSFLPILTIQEISPAVPMKLAASLAPRRWPPQWSQEFFLVPGNHLAEI
jgi:hypothetical protein